MYVVRIIPRNNSGSRWVRRIMALDSFEYTQDIRLALPFRVHAAAEDVAANAIGSYLYSSGWRAVVETAS